MNFRDPFKMTVAELLETHREVNAGVTRFALKDKRGKPKALFILATDEDAEAFEAFAETHAEENRRYVPVEPECQE